MVSGPIPQPRSSGRLRCALAALPLLLGVLGGGLALAPAARADQESDAGRKGAQIYCFMRNSGNSHAVSWDAAYAVIKRQSDSLFKTSPQHAAVLITEAVVGAPADFPECGRYLGDLFRQPEPSTQEKAEPSRGTSGVDRYAN
jgi:hypothetical protein